MNFATMNLITAKLASTMANTSTDALNSSSSGFFDAVLTVIKHYYVSVFDYFINALNTLIYAIMKYVLALIDFIFVMVRQMAGMNEDFTKLSDIDNDLIFKFVFNENVVRVIRGLIGFAIILIILFAIIAILKNEYNYVATKGSNSKAGIFRDTLRSIFLLLFIPIMFIGGVIMSNAILRSLYIATAGGEDTSLTNQIFVASAYDANAYRRYADRDQKIPITLNFDEIGPNDNVTHHPMEGSIKEVDEAFTAFRQNSVWDRGFSTFLMFYEDTFFSMDDIDQYQSYADNQYNDAFDKNIRTRKEEYYVMADAIDYALKSGETLYFKTAEEIYNTYGSVLRSAPSDVRNQMVDPKISNSGRNYSFSIRFAGEEVPTVYNHSSGAHSETDGAVYMVALRKEITSKTNGLTYYYYSPLRSAEDNFMTDYYAEAGQPVVARGIFEDGVYPTAIRDVDGEVKFYRDKLNIPTLVDFFPKISYELPEGATPKTATSLLKGISKAILGVDILPSVPYVYFSFDIFNLFTKQTYNVLTMPNGMLKIDYMFSMRNIKLDNLYNASDINLFVLVFSSVLMVGILVKVLLGLARRVLDITMLAITYPAVVSTIPLDGGSRLKGWTSDVVSKLLSVYGTVIGINIILLLIPQINQINLITPAMIHQSFGLDFMPFKFTTWLCNEVVHLLFILVAFSSMKMFNQTISEILGVIVRDRKGNVNKDDDVYDMGQDVYKDLAQMPQKVGRIVTGQFIKDGVKNAGKFVTGMIPGSAIVTGINEAREDSRLLHQNRQNSNERMQEMRDAARSASSGGGGTTPPSGGTTPPSGGTTPPSGGTTPPSGGATPPSGGGSTPPSGGATPPSGGSSDSSTSADETAEAPEDVSAEDSSEGTSEGGGDTSPEGGSSDKTTEADETAEAPEEASEDSSEGTGEGTASETPSGASEGESTEADETAEAPEEASNEDKPSSGDTVVKDPKMQTRSYNEYYYKKEQYAKNQTALNYAKQDPEEYKKYLEENGLEDNDESKRAFYNAESDKADEAFARYNETRKTEDIETYRAFNKKEKATKRAAMDENEVADQYTDADKEGYKKYLQASGQDDSIESRIAYYNDRKVNEDKDKFNNMSKTGRFLNYKNNRSYTENNKFVDDFAQNNSEYKKYLEERGAQDSQESRAYFYVSKRNSINQSMNNEYNKYLQSNGLKDNAASKRSFEQEKKKYYNGEGDRKSSLGMAVNDERIFKEKVIQSQIRSNSTLPGHNMKDVSNYADMYKDDYTQYIKRRHMKDDDDSKAKFFSHEEVVNDDFKSKLRELSKNKGDKRRLNNEN